MLTELNDILLRHGDRERFCTAVFAHLDTRAAGAVRLASGGHLPPILIRNGRPAELTEVRGTLLGVVEAPRLAGFDVELAVGDTLVFVTDGVVEARTAGGEAIGSEGALGALTRTGEATPQAIADDLADLAQDVPGGQRDDIAVLVLRRTS